MHDCSLLIKRQILWKEKKRKKKTTKPLDALFIADNSYFVLYSQEVSVHLNISTDFQYKKRTFKNVGRKIEQVQKPKKQQKTESRMNAVPTKYGPITPLNLLTFPLSTPWRTNAHTHTHAHTLSY